MVPTQAVHSGGLCPPQRLRDPGNGVPAALLLDHTPKGRRRASTVGIGPFASRGVTSSLRVEGKDFHSTGEETQCQRDSESHPRRWRPPSALGFWLPVPSSLCSSGVLDIRTAGARWEK